MLESEAETNRRKKFEALGRFVQAFELMVDATRTASIGIFRIDQQLLNIVLHHQSMSAKMLFEIMRASMAYILNRTEDQFSTEAKTIFTQVSAQIWSDYDRLLNKRNELLHGTWRLNFDDTPEGLAVTKWKVKSVGLAKADLPATLPELTNLTGECNETHRWIFALGICFVDGTVNGVEKNLKHTFSNSDKRWHLVANVRVAT